MNKQNTLKLMDMLTNEVNGTTFISIDTCVIPTLNKTLNGRGSEANPHFGRITKKQVGSSVMVFQNKNINGYDAMVKRRLATEGKDPESFVLGVRKWGVRLPNAPIVELRGEFYMEAIFLKAGVVTYYLDGVEINRDEIIGMRTDNFDNESQAGLSDKVIIRTFKFDSIEAMRINGTEHKFS